MAKKVKWQAKTRIDKINESSIPASDIQSLVESGRGRKLMKGFMEVLESKLQGQLRKHKVGHSGDLSASFKTSVSASGDRISGKFGYLYYGRFVDMGVGKGVTASEQESGVALTQSRVGSHRRKKKPWYLETVPQQKKRLSEVFAEATAKDLEKQVSDALNSEVKITL